MKGDRVRLIKFPQATGTVRRIVKGKYPMIWCSLPEDENHIVAFGEPNSVELNPNV